MAGTDRGTPEHLGWRLDVDHHGGELRLEHGESGRTFVLDADGGLRVPGEGDIGADLQELRTALASALEPADRDAPAAQQGSTCRVECDETTGDVTIEGSGTISLAAPVIEIAADAQLELSVSGQLDVSSDGTARMTADGPLQLEGAVIHLN